MSIFVKATPSPTPKTKDVRRIANAYAVILVVMAILQLFTFEQFLKLVTTFNFPGGDRYAYFIATFVIIAEMLAIPFLLRTPLSPAFRWLSMICSWLVALIWAKLTIWLVIKDGISNNVGFLGTTIVLTPGWWAVFISIALGLMAAWATWGMWPGKPSLKRVSKRRK